jgi:hypothetical protein
LRADQIEEVGAFRTTDPFEAFGQPVAVAA